jgi:hypothetical protein
MFEKGGEGRLRGERKGEHTHGLVLLSLLLLLFTCTSRHLGSVVQCSRRCSLKSCVDLLKNEGSRTI